MSSTTAAILVKFPLLSKWSGCRVENCTIVFIRARMVLTTVAYFFTILVFLMTGKFAFAFFKNAFHRIT